MLEVSDPRDGFAEDDPDDNGRLPYYAVQSRCFDLASDGAEDQNPVADLNSRQYVLNMTTVEL